jgi:chromate transporter
LFLALFVLLLVLLPVAARLTGGLPLALVDSFYRSGALVFGGGHVILPLLQAEVVPPGWIERDLFLAGYGAAQAVPGPLLTFSAYLGAMADPRLGGWPAGVLCLVAVFLPSFLLVIGVLPFWDALRRHGKTQSAMAGVNAAVVGLLVAALYNPVWTSAIHGPGDFALAIVAFVALALWNAPPWLVVIGCGLAGAVMGAI